jgi:hypothetical protein
VDAALRRKLDDKAWEGVFVGNSPDSPTWLIYNPTTKRTVAIRSVIFDECELLSLFPDHVHDTGSILPFQEPTDLAETIYDGRTKLTRPPPQNAADPDSDDDHPGDSAPTIMDSTLTPEKLQQNAVVVWGVTSPPATLAAPSSPTRGESIPSPTTRDQPHDPSDTTAATTSPTDDPNETTVISTPTNDQHLRRGTRQRLPSFKLRDSGDSLLTALPLEDLNTAGQHVTDDHLHMHWASVLLAEARGLPRDSTESVMTLLQHGPAEPDIESNSNVTPKTMKEALNSPKNTEWKAAIKREYDGIRDRSVFRVVPIPAGKRVLSTKWDFTIKKNKDGSIRKYKARWVVRGFAQREGEDFDKSKLYALVVSFSSVRTALAMAAQWKWAIYQLDVVAAFLYADIHEELYISLPEGFKEFDSNGKELFGRL